MFTILFRRLQKYFLPIKIGLLIAAGFGLYFLVFNTSPDLVNVVGFTLLLVLVIASILSFFLSAKFYLPVAIGVPFLLFLKAVALLSVVNVGLLAVFIILFEMSLLQLRPKENREAKETPPVSTRALFPKGWIPRLGKKKKEE